VELVNQLAVMACNMIVARWR